jgi:hypothetical protein
MGQRGRVGRMCSRAPLRSAVLLQQQRTRAHRLTPAPSALLGALAALWPQCRLQSSAVLARPAVGSLTAALERPACQSPQPRSPGRGGCRRLPAASSAPLARSRRAGQPVRSAPRVSDRKRAAPGRPPRRVPATVARNQTYFTYYSHPKKQPASQPASQAAAKLATVLDLSPQAKPRPFSRRRPPARGARVAAAGRRAGRAVACWPAGGLAH